MLARWIEDKALVIARSEGRNRMATAAGLQNILNRVAWAVADHAQHPRGAYVPGVGARIEPDLIRAPESCGCTEDGDLAAISVDQRYAVAARAEKFIGTVDRQTTRPAIAAGHVDAPQEDQLSGFWVEDIDATDCGPLGERLVEESLLRVPDRLLDAAARGRQPASRGGFSDIVIGVEELVQRSTVYLTC